MNNVGIDLGKKQSDVCVVNEQGAVCERFKISTNRAALSKRFVNVPACTIVIESCRDSGWVHEHLTSLGHKVVVVDTTRARAIGIGQGRRKTDRRDAEALARAAAHNILPRAHVLSERGRHLRDVLHTRDHLVQVRSSIVTMMRGQFQGRGFILPTCTTEKFPRCLRDTGFPGVDAIHTQALLSTLDELNERIATLNQQLTTLAQQQEAFERLTSLPGVKLIVALSFIAAIDDPSRFKSAHQLQAYLGLVPSEYSTGGKRRTGRITRCGNPMARRLLVNAASALMRTLRAQQDPLVVWAKGLGERRGRKRARVALARRMAGVLWAMWMDGTFYDPQGLARQSACGLRRHARYTQRVAKAMETVAHAA